MSIEEKSTPESPQPEETQKGFIQRIFVRDGHFQTFLLPLLAIFTALVIGGIIIAFSIPETLEVWSTQGASAGFAASWEQVKTAYVSLFQGAFGQWSQMSEAIRIYRNTGENTELLRAFRPISESLVVTTPYIFAGLALTIGFRGGLFNIGAEGQLFVGGLASVYVGYSITSLPWFIHLPLAILAGILAGGIWGAIPGILKAWRGAHEVINTIMMNYIAFLLADFMLNGPMARADGMPITPEIAQSAYLPAFFDRPMRIHWGFILALVFAWLVYWFLWKTKYGLEIRMVGSNPRGARYAGINVTMITAVTMALSGALAALAGVSQTLGVEHKMAPSFSPGYGFDAIALALLGNSHPVGVVLASILFGFMRSGAARMQSAAGVPVEIIRIIQGMVIVFVAAPEIVRSIYRLKKPKETTIS